MVQVHVTRLDKFWQRHLILSMLAQPKVLLRLRYLFSKLLIHLHMSLIFYNIILFLSIRILRSQHVNFSNSLPLSFNRKCQQHLLMFVTARHKALFNLRRIFSKLTAQVHVTYQSRFWQPHLFWSVLEQLKVLLCLQYLFSKF